MDSETWPPAEGEDWSLGVLLRLQSLCATTQVRFARWTGEVAEVRVWPYSDDIASAIREQLAPLATTVEPQESLPQPGLQLDGTTVWVTERSDADSRE